MSTCICQNYSSISYSEDKYLALRSVLYPGQHIGIEEDGELKPYIEMQTLDRSFLFIPFPQSSVTTVSGAP